MSPITLKELSIAAPWKLDKRAKTSLHSAGDSLKELTFNHHSSIRSCCESQLGRLVVVHTLLSLLLLIIH